MSSWFPGSILFEICCDGLGAKNLQLRGKAKFGFEIAGKWRRFTWTRGFCHSDLTWNNDKQWNIWLQYLLGYLGWQTNWQQRSDSCWEPKIVIVWILWLYGGSFASHGLINWFLVFVACWSKNLNLEWATSESLGQYAGDSVVNRMWDHSGCVWKGVCQAARFFTCSIYIDVFAFLVWFGYDYLMIHDRFDMCFVSSCFFKERQNALNRWLWKM